MQRTAVRRAFPIWLLGDGMGMRATPNGEASAIFSARQWLSPAGASAPRRTPTRPQSQASPFFVVFVPSAATGSRPGANAVSANGVSAIECNLVLAARETLLTQLVVSFSLQPPGSTAKLRPVNKDYRSID